MNAWLAAALVVGLFVAAGICTVAALADARREDTADDEMWVNYDMNEFKRRAAVRARRQGTPQSAKHDQSREHHEPDQAPVTRRDS